MTGGRRKFPVALRARVWTKAGGRCTHCGVELPEDAAWHVDHHPVPFRDIEHQVCCGVTDPMDESNLVASCARCNVSHAHEPTGRSQIPCDVRVWRLVGVATAAALCGAVVGAVAVYYRMRDER
jgi:5-methylcytosine-specific restriction endonuclease McrA